MENHSLQGINTTSEPVEVWQIVGWR